MKRNSHDYGTQDRAARSRRLLSLGALVTVIASGGLGNAPAVLGAPAHHAGTRATHSGPSTPGLGFDCDHAAQRSADPS